MRPGTVVEIPFINTNGKYKVKFHKDGGRYPEMEYTMEQANKFFKLVRRAKVQNDIKFVGKEIQRSVPVERMMRRPSEYTKYNESIFLKGHLVELTEEYP